MSRKLKIHLVSFIKLLALLIVIFVAPYFIHISAWKINKALADQSSSSLSGYAWSENIGWVSLSGSNYGLSIDTNKKLSGYAWSDNIGWISANDDDLEDCPKTPCTAKLQSNNLNGWLKVLSGGTANSGSWDGWISLSGKDPDYGPVLSNGTFSGYAWGGDVVGWLDFSYAIAPSSINSCTPSYSCSGNETILYTNSSCEISTFATCEEPAFCSAGSSTCLYPPPSFSASDGFNGHLQVRPSLVKKDDPVKIYWNLDNVSSCTVTGTNGDSWNGGSSGTPGKTSRPIIGQTTYTLVCGAHSGSTPDTVTESVTVNIIPIFEEK